MLVDACSLVCAESDVSNTASSLDAKSLVVSSSRALDSGFSSLRGLDGGVSSLRGLDGGGVPLLSAWAFATFLLEGCELSHHSLPPSFVPLPLGQASL